MRIVFHWTDLEQVAHILASFNIVYSCVLAPGAAPVRGCVLEPDGAYLALHWSPFIVKVRARSPRAAVISDRGKSCFINSLVMCGWERCRVQWLFNVSSRREQQLLISAVIIMMTVFLHVFVCFNHVRNWAGSRKHCGFSSHFSVSPTSLSATKLHWHKRLWPALSGN